MTVLIVFKTDKISGIWVQTVGGEYGCDGVCPARFDFGFPGSQDLYAVLALHNPQIYGACIYTVAFIHDLKCHIALIAYMQTFHSQYGIAAHLEVFSEPGETDELGIGRDCYHCGQQSK